MRLRRLVPVLLLLAGCAEHGPFVPADADRRAPENRRAALYEIRTGSGDWNTIVVRVWPEGTADGPPPDMAGAAPPGTYAKFAFRIRNDWTSPVDLPVTDIRLAATTAKTTPAPSTPIGTPPTARVAPGEERTVHIFVLLPAPPRDTASLELSWRLTSGDKSYRQTTTFVRDRDTDDYYYMPYDDPFWYGWGPVERGAGWRSGVSLGIGISN